MLLPNTVMCLVGIRGNATQNTLVVRRFGGLQLHLITEMLSCVSFCVLQEMLQQGCIGMLCASAGCEGNSPGGVHQDICQVSDPDGFTPLGQVCDR